MKKQIAIATVILALACVTSYASFVPPPVISGVRVTGITTNSATISWKTSVVADSQVAYGLTPSYGSLSALDPSLVTLHSLTLSGLSPYTMYHFQVRSTGSTGRIYLAGDFAFTTAANLVPGMVSGVAVAAISNTSATITWTTNLAANSIVEYGPTANYVLSTGDAALVFSHSVTLINLAAGSLYHFHVKSVDPNGNVGFSDDATFTTTTNGSTLVFSAIAAAFVTSTSATITWSTNIPSGSQIEYGPTTSYGEATIFDSTQATAHSQTLNGLVPGSVYHYAVMSAEVANDVVPSADQVFSTPTLSVYLPHVSLVPNQSMGIALTNLDVKPASLQYTAFDAGGAQIQGSGITNPASSVLNFASQMALTIDQVFGPVTGTWGLGWAAINSSNADVPGFFLTYDSALSLLDGANLSSILLRSFVLPEVGSQDYTRIFLANSSGNAVSVTIDLVKVDGTIRATMQTNIAAFATYSADLKAQVFPGVAVDPSDYVQVNSTTGLVAYEYFGNVGKDVAVLSGADLNDGGITLYSPQYAVGGTWNSALSIVNLDSNPGSVAIQLIGDDGVQIGPTQVLPIAANGKIYISDQSFFLGFTPAQIVEGYVQVASSGVRLAGSIVFSDAVRGTFSTALPLVSGLAQSVVLSHVASNSTFFTGLAILNANSADAHVQVQLYTADGQLDQSATVIVPAWHRISEVLQQYFPALAGQDRTSGYIKVTSDLGIASFGVFGTSNLSVLAAIPAQQVR